MNEDLLYMYDKYEVRHKILQCLHRKITYDSKGVPNLPKTKTPLKKIAEETGIPYDVVLHFHHGIPDNQAICIHGSPTHEMMLLREGLDAYRDKFWIKEGTKNFNKSADGFLKWFLPLIIAFIAIYTTVKSSQDSSQTTKELLRLQREIDSLKLSKPY